MSDPRADTIRPQPWRAVEDIAKSDAGGWLMEFTARNLIRERDALVADLEAARAKIAADELAVVGFMRDRDVAVADLEAERTAHSETAAAAESEYRDFVRVRAERDVAVERARTGAEKIAALQRVAGRQPIAVDISDFSDEFCAGFLRGQENALIAAANALAALAEETQ